MIPPPPKIERIDPRTCWPNSVYPKHQPESLAYVDEFSRALGLKPAVTKFGSETVKV